MEPIEPLNIVKARSNARDHSEGRPLWFYLKVAWNWSKRVLLALCRGIREFFHLTVGLQLPQFSRLAPDDKIAGNSQKEPDFKAAVAQMRHGFRASADEKNGTEAKRRCAGNGKNNRGLFVEDESDSRKWLNDQLDEHASLASKIASSKKN